MRPIKNSPLYLARIFSLVLKASSFLLLVQSISIAHAQDAWTDYLDGYITAVHPDSPGMFDVNGRHVSTTADTTYSMLGQDITKSDANLKTGLQLGAYVQILGDYDHKTKTIMASSVQFRDEMNKKLVGLGVISSVTSLNGSPEFEADGYRIRLDPHADVSFEGDLKSVSEIKPNNWIKYEGKRDEDGDIIATNAKFLPAKFKPIKAVTGVERFKMGFEEPDFANNKPGRVKVSPLGSWRVVLADRALQERLNRIGANVVPAYQKAMAEDDPAKIHFRFYAIDEDKIRTEICSLDGSLILVPAPIIQRLKTDSQVATVLADGVAYALQRQGALQISAERAMLGMEAAGLALLALNPGLGLVLAAEGSNAFSMNVQSKEYRLLMEERGRIALALMADAGYDPWAAPETWRLLEPKRLPQDLTTLKYPHLSGYQLGILHLQYSANRKSEMAKPVSAASQ